MQTIKVKWTGIRPMIMHNGILADPTNDYTRKIKAITDKGSKKMTEADHETRNRLEWEGSLYWTEKLGLYVPSDNIERCVQLGAQKSRLGKDVQAVCFCQEEEIQVVYAGPKEKDKLYASDRFQIRRGVRVQKSRIIRVRPMIPTGWSVTFTLEYDESVVDRKDVLKAMIDAGALIGLGDWRPKFGRFTVAEM
jgi:hypothetical protein